MQSNVLMSCLNHVKDYVTSILTETFSIAKPLVAIFGSASNYAVWFMDPTVDTGV